MDLFTGEFHRQYLSRELRVSNGMSEPAKRLFDKCAPRDGFFLSVVEIAGGGFTEASGLPWVNPIGCLVAGVGKST